MMVCLASIPWRHPCTRSVNLIVLGTQQSNHAFIRKGIHLAREKCGEWSESHFLYIKNDYSGGL